jgi:hypothetical protein
MVNPGREMNLGRFKWIIGRKVDVQEKDSASIW